MPTLGSGTKDDPWQLKTPSLTSDYLAWRDPDADPPALVCQVGTTRLRGSVVGVWPDGECLEAVMGGTP